MLNKMLSAVRSSTTQHISIFPPNRTLFARKPSGLRLAQSASGPKPNQHDSSEEMDQQKGPESKIRDTMSSMGEGYATRSDEEGFGGVYGGNQYVSTDDNDKNSEFDESQGSEVKEKEKARNQSEAADSTPKTKND